MGVTGLHRLSYLKVLVTRNTGNEVNGIRVSEVAKPRAVSRLR